ncbi:MAG: hypothetical protein WBQ16_10065 [Nitrososphaeraceae archaeon]
MSKLGSRFSGCCKLCNTSEEYKNSYMLVQTVNTNSIPTAAGIGFCIEDNNTNEKAVYGLIIMNEHFVNNQFPFEESEFIVFHECSHIVNNHSVATIPINLPEVYATMVNLIDKKQLPLMILEGIKALYIRYLEKNTSIPN